MSISSKLKTVNSLYSSGVKGWKSLIWNTSMAKMKRSWPLMRPSYVAIEPTNACNAKCPVCETGKDEMYRTKGMLDLNLFKDFIDKNHAQINTLMYYFMGEPFLNKNSYEMIRYARKKNIYVETCTNGDFVDAKGVIYSDINKISFQIGGMTEKTHQIYRVASSLEKIKKNLFELIEERKKNPESNVTIELGFIVMRHNEHEVDKFLKWSNELNVDVANIIDPCVRNMVEGYAYLPKNKSYWFYDSDAFELGKLKPKIIPKNSCEWIWNSMQINWDGEAVPCCRDPNGIFPLGNVFEKGMLNVFNSKESVNFRKNIINKQNGVNICSLCSSYGLPVLQKNNPGNFQVNHHSVNQDQSAEISSVIKNEINL